MKCTKCGGNRFIATRTYHISVIVDEENYFVENYGEDMVGSVSGRESPHGPYICMRCRSEYDTMERDEETVVSTKESKPDSPF